MTNRRKPLIGKKKQKTSKSSRLKVNNKLGATGWGISVWGGGFRNSNDSPSPTSSITELLLKGFFKIKVVNIVTEVKVYIANFNYIIIFEPQTTCQIAHPQFHPIHHPIPFIPFSTQYTPV